MVLLPPHYHHYRHIDILLGKVIGQKSYAITALTVPLCLFHDQMFQSSKNMEDEFELELDVRKGKYFNLSTVYGSCSD
jgi:hypothetical protein